MLTGQVGGMPRVSEKYHSPGSLARLSRRQALLRACHTRKAGGGIEH